MTLQLDHAQYDAALAAIRDETDRLTSATDRLERRVADTLDTWQGRAAQSYAEAWTDWQRGAREVLAALDATADALAATHRDLTETDDGTAVDHRRLAGRLG